jgi:hypothetical protein
MASVSPVDLPVAKAATAAPSGATAVEGWASPPSSLWDDDERKSTTPLASSSPDRREAIAQLYMRLGVAHESAAASFVGGVSPHTIQLSLELALGKIRDEFVTGPDRDTDYSIAAYGAWAWYKQVRDRFDFVDSAVTKPAIDWHDIIRAFSEYEHNKTAQALLSVAAESVNADNALAFVVRTEQLRIAFNAVGKPIFLAITDCAKQNFPSRAANIDLVACAAGISSAPEVFEKVKALRREAYAASDATCACNHKRKRSQDESAETEPVTKKTKTLGGRANGTQ